MYHIFKASGFLWPDDSPIDQRQMCLFAKRILCTLNDPETQIAIADHASKQAFGKEAIRRCGVYVV
jgi:hypothetical protein